MDKRSSEGTFNYLVSAIELIAQHGASLLPYYQFDAASGTWGYQGNKMKLSSSLDDLDFTNLTTENTDKRCEIPFVDLLARASEELQNHTRKAKKYTLELPKSAEALRWFMLPQEIKAHSTASRARLSSTICPIGQVIKPS